jgi:hypothetical protein
VEGTRTRQHSRGDGPWISQVEKSVLAEYRSKGPARREAGIKAGPPDAEVPKLKAEGGNMDLMDLENRFTYHAPKPGQPEKYEAIRSKALELAILINDSCPDSREKSLAITSLGETVMWTNASVSRNG